MLKRLLRILRGRQVVVPDVAKIADGEARGVNVGDPAAGGVRIILCRVKGRLHALDSRCPHQGGRIETGKLVEGRYAECPLHRFWFEPSNGRPVRGACASATVYRVVEKDGAATVRL